MPFAAAPSPGEYLTIAELIERWPISRTTVWRWASAGIPGTAMRLNPVRLGRRVLFRRETVEHIEAALTATATPAKPIRRRRRRATA
jgi:hypothetical protein